MGAVQTAPRRDAGYDGRVREVDHEVARLDRKRQPAAVTPPFVRVAPYPVQAWAVGTCWLDTTTVGPLSSHPLLVKQEADADHPEPWWDQVAWLVPVD